MKTNDKTPSPTSIVTNPLRCSYAHVWQAVAMKDQDKKKYSISLIIPKADKASLKQIQKAVDAATTAGIESKWKGKKPAKLKLPLRDGDEDRPDDPNYADSFFITASSDTRPGILGPDKQQIIDEEDFYSGCYCRASLNFYAFDVAGNKGIGVGLNNLMKVKDGERLSGRASAESDFADVEVEEDDDDIM